jgi:undecaprenyl-phosphate galactose phosphotransferase
VTAEVYRYSENIDDYTIVRPGITGLWQVSGRNNVSYDERVEMDAWYVRNWSIWLDIFIILKTIPALLSKSGAY